MPGLFLARTRIAGPPKRPRGQGVHELQVAEQADWPFVAQELPLCAREIGAHVAAISRATGEDAESVAHCAAVAVAVTQWVLG